jgi:hypothetical protein
MSDDETPPVRRIAESTVDEVVERTRGMLRRSRELLEASRDLLNKVHPPATPSTETHQPDDPEQK